jgi:hypothetical protein
MEARFLPDFGLFYDCSDDVSVDGLQLLSEMSFGPIRDQINTGFAVCNDVRVAIAGGRAN